MMPALGTWLSRTRLTAVLATTLAVVGSGVPGAAARATAGPPLDSGSQPPGRAWPSFAYDPALDELVLFGGDNGRAVYGGTWIYQAGAWTKEAPALSPAPRTGAALVYDAATGQLLLFGGSSKIGTAGGYFGDTWVWDGSTWTQLHPAVSPPARHNADMIYDAAGQDVVLFGGYDGHYLGDTWTWDGSTWTRQDTPLAPAPRDTGSFAYDTAAGLGVLYGGFNGVTAFKDTWTWNGSTWTKISTAASPGRVTAGWQMADDTAAGQVLLFGGGRYNHTNSGATWEWTGTTWTHLQPAAAPFGRGVGSMSYDSATGQIVLFGGQGYHQRRYPATTWTWTGTTWQKIA
jgi:Kelch motif